MEKDVKQSSLSLAFHVRPRDRQHLYSFTKSYNDVRVTETVTEIKEKAALVQVVE